ncbi:MAG: hypothetical protein ACOH2J_06775 [Allorhizobium sp.]
MPGFGLWFAAALLWGAAMALSAGLSLALDNRAENFHLPVILALYFFGGVLGWLAALPLFHARAQGRAAEVRLAMALLCLTAGTTLSTASLFALQYRLFYAQWHEPFATRIWFFQFAFTSASAIYQFAVLGLRLFFPFGFVCLFAASWGLMRRSR